MIWTSPSTTTVWTMVSGVAAGAPPPHDDRMTLKTTNRLSMRKFLRIVLLLTRFERV
jgi:hypothetical protein